MKPTYAIALLALAARLSAGPVLQPANIGAGASAHAFSLAEPGSNWLLDYAKYGVMKEVGTPHYHYDLTDARGLAQATGESIYPNNYSLQRDPAFLAMKAKLKLPDSDKGLFADDPTQAQANVFRWAASKQPEGVKLWFIGEAFREAGLWVEALKAYDALLVHFPETTRLADSGTWGLALGSTAIQRIKLICREHPELNLELVDAQVDIKDPGQLDEKVLALNPGHFVDRRQFKAPDLAQIGVRQMKGTGRVKLVEYNNGHWGFYVDNKPYWVKGLAWGLTKIGQSPDLQNVTSWEQGNDPEPWTKTWWDKNRNNAHDPGEDVNDLALLKAMGINTLRIYYGCPNKAALRNLYKQAGIRVMMGNAFGAYALDAGTTWEQGTDYSNPRQQEYMLNSVRKMVMEHKDEPYLLAYCLGNENIYGAANNSNKYPATFAHLLQKACKLIHRLDPDHPVVYSNGDLAFLDEFVRQTPDLDILGCNVYRGKEGAGDLYERVSKEYDKPVLITEFGAPAFNNAVHGEDEQAQADYIEGNLKDMAYNRAGGMGAGNALGGFLFEWQDEWWKAGSTKPPDQHDHSGGQAPGPFVDGMFHEEWFGLTSQGNGNDSPNMRQLRKAYYTVQKYWRN
jgi:beta-glucuronidase